MLTRTSFYLLIEKILDFQKDFEGDALEFAKKVEKNIHVVMELSKELSADQLYDYNKALNKVISRNVDIFITIKELEELKARLTEINGIPEILEDCKELNRIMSLLDISIDSAILRLKLAADIRRKYNL